MFEELEQPSRVVPLEGGVNFRDLGGYKTEDGREVRWRKLFRCGHLGDLTSRDIDALAHLDVSQVHDFRRREEQERTPSQALRATVYADYEMFVGSMSKFWEFITTHQLSAETAHDLVVGSYRECIDDVAPHYRRLFTSLVQNRERASLFHCSAGKDRTGIAAALILSALGVSREVVVEDYMLTREHFDSERLLGVVEQHLRNAEIKHWERSWLEPYCGVHQDNIEAFFEGVDSRYGSVGGYLRDALGLNGADLEMLQKSYLAQ
ncbi:tyrosine-protein phosphatase [Pseudomaricurvus alkylphenolicus]|jgi:protein-tyrosine phosphatase|uniref:tyrosine-protein phosphatase n=1 Tax=Pseudomaricurvus alkylphenolicus TaxID=1306991 RepID=UPI001420E40C|nr:tyrosine-protein phosphatase [Pseudomaricurvus alkylphenolicus]NIB41805.1 tyrosine-protein phosphatase [Pseudomaricurvus alkylphenolicus]